jgi:hypothetical protein
MLSGKYWISFYPGVALLVGDRGINLVGDQLRDVLNPRLKRMTVSMTAPPRHRCCPEVRDLQTHFPRAAAWCARWTACLHDRPGEILGPGRRIRLGQVVTGFSIMGLVDAPGRIVGGSILFQGRELTGSERRRMRKIRGNRIAMIFQDPMMTLNPVLRIDTQMIETVLAHQDVSRAEARRARDALGGRHPVAGRAAATPTRTSSPAACASASRSPSRC